MQRVFLFVYTIFLCFLNLVALAQEPVIETIPNQPSPEAYDLLKDSKGYLWVGHDQGISRYDGARFINLYHPQQSSIAMTNLIEDKNGRIWCHNFSGQIFYIENLQLHLFAGYKYKEEPGFPRITICGDELVATSSKGLFVHSLRTGRSTYHLLPKGSASLTRVGNRVVLYGGGNWYSYECGKGVTKIPIDRVISNENVRSLQLQPVADKDTFYIIANPAGVYYKMTLQGNGVKVHEENRTGVFINTITVQDNKVWVHTKESSYTTYGRTVIRGMNLSDLVRDREGNQWVSSLKRGLCVEYKAPSIKKFNDSLLHAGQDIRTIYTAPNEMYWGTTNGQLYHAASPFSLRHIASFPKQAGAIERIAALDKGHLVVGTSVGLFTYNHTTRAVQQLPIDITVKDALFYKEKLYLALISGVKVFTKGDLAYPKSMLWKMEPLAGKETRCRSISFTGDSLVAAFSDGVYIIYQNRLQPLLYKGNEIYATTIRASGGKVVIGTFTQGLFVLAGDQLTNITTENGLAANFVKDIKTIGSSTWLLFADHIQQLNGDLSGVVGYPVFFPKGGITDFGLLDNRLFITSTNGVYHLKMNTPEPENLSQTFIDKVEANNADLIRGNQLQPFQNYLRLHVSTPFFSSDSKIIYQYRIKDAPDSAWQRGAPGQDAFDLIVLEPGEHTFEVVATDLNGKIISQPASYHFELMPAWYQHWLFRLLAVLAVVAIGLYIVWVYYRNRLRQQQLAYKRQLAVQAERHRISAEIHDDMGASLSAIRLLTEMTKNKLPESEAKQEVGKIYASVSELSYKMREVIWSLNPDNDHLENLLNYIRRQALVLFENSSIRLKVIFPSGDIPAMIIKGEKRRHIYLSVKEALHNCLKHSCAQNCTLTISIEGSLLRITITDDGRGFMPVENESVGNGMTSMRRRMQAVNGIFEVAVEESTHVQFLVPLKENV